jgi:1-acyl-sn-glycerol-3-phosphate acyltransferase
MKVGLRRAFRLARLAVHVAAGAALVTIFFFRCSRATRVAVRKRWCRQALDMLGVRLRLVGAVPADCHLFAANHISWLDVIAIGAVLPCWYVSKDEIRAWPFFGWMAAANDTLFLRRQSARAVYRMNAEIRTRLEQRQSVVVFPEGTTTDGTRVLPFYPALFQPAIDTAMPVLPLAISYFDATSAPDTAVAYIDDDPVWTSLRAVLDAPRTEVRLVLDHALAGEKRNRRELASRSCAAIRRLQSRQAEPREIAQPRPAHALPLQPLAMKQSAIALTLKRPVRSPRMPPQPPSIYRDGPATGSDLHSR